MLNTKHIRRHCTHHLEVSFSQHSRHHRQHGACLGHHFQAPTSIAPDSDFALTAVLENHPTAKVIVPGGINGSDWANGVDAAVITTAAMLDERVWVVA
jgi:hypothetical protein